MDENFVNKNNAAIDISIPLRFNGPQPNAYGVEPAAAEACEYGELIGDTRRGGSCNFERYTFIPHCNGTHTECVGHITDDRISVRDCLKDVLIDAVLISVSPTSPSNFSLMSETEAQTLVNNGGADDLLITRKMLSEGLGTFAYDIPRPTFRNPHSVIIRTLPNSDEKLTREYGTENPGAVSIPPYFTQDAMRFIVECGFTHLLCDLPSIDRIYDDGELLNHRIFWNVEPESRKITDETRTASTITELIYVPNKVPDGRYLLNLQIAPFEADAAPSRPMLLPAN